MKSSAGSGGKCWRMWKLPLWDEAVAPVRGCVCSWEQQTSVVCIERPSKQTGNIHSWADAPRRLLFDAPV